MFKGCFRARRVYYSGASGDVVCGRVVFVEIHASSIARFDDATTLVITSAKENSTHGIACSRQLPALIFISPLGAHRIRHGAQASAILFEGDAPVGIVSDCEKLCARA